MICTGYVVATFSLSEVLYSITGQRGPQAVRFRIHNYQLKVSTVFYLFQHKKSMQTNHYLQLESFHAAILNKNRYLVKLVSYKDISSTSGDSCLPHLYRSLSLTKSYACSYIIIILVALNILGRQNIHMI